jgi:hypothetical protein
VRCRHLTYLRNSVQRRIYTPHPPSPPPPPPPPFVPASPCALTRGVRAAITCLAARNARTFSLVAPWNNSLVFTCKHGGKCVCVLCVRACVVSVRVWPCLSLFDLIFAALVMGPRGRCGGLILCRRIFSSGTDLEWVILPNIFGFFLCLSSRQNSTPLAIARLKSAITMDFVGRSVRRAALEKWQRRSLAQSGYIQCLLAVENRPEGTIRRASYESPHIKFTIN